MYGLSECLWQLCTVNSFKSELCFPEFSFLNCLGLDISVGRKVKLTNIATYLLATLGSGATDPPGPARFLSSNSLSPNQVYLQ